MKRFENISPFMVMDILQKARQMEDVIHLEVGEPDLNAPPGVIEEFMKAVKDGKYKYTSALGLRELRERISAFYHQRYGVSVSPERIAITPGTSGAFLVVYALLLDSGDRIILSDPSYPCYKNFSHILNIEPVFVPVDEDNGFCISVDTIKRNQDVKAIQISSPSNPLGNLYKERQLSDVIDAAAKNRMTFISDEIYHGLVYDEKEHSALEFSKEVIVINGFSKYFCMPGFRLGWMILPEDLVRKAEIAIQNLFIAANTPSQYAAVKAFDEGHLQMVHDTFRERRDFIYSALKGVFEIPLKPEGAFYLWADISRFGIDSLSFAERLLEVSRVAATPGVDFGTHRTDKYIRIAFTRPVDELREGVERIQEFVSSF